MKLKKCYCSSKNITVKYVLSIFSIFYLFSCINVLAQNNKSQEILKYVLSEAANHSSIVLSLGSIQTSIILTTGNYTCGEFGYNDLLYVIRNDSLLTLDVNTMTETPIGAITGINSGQTITCMSYAFGSGIMYLGTTSLGSSELYSLNLTNASASFIGPVGEPALMAFDIDCSGDAYSFDIMTDNLYLLDLNTGSVTQIGPLGFDANYQMHAQFDLSLASLYLIAFNNTTFSTQFRSVDINTGSTTLIQDLGSIGVTVFAIDGNCGIPVELSDFTGHAMEGKVILNWSTATETNNRGFEVERQVGNGPSAVVNWEKIGFVEGNGTTTESHSYSFIDNNFSSGVYTYRLKQIDFDGSYKYSNVVEISTANPTKFSLNQNYPNPFNPSTVIGYQLPENGQVTLKVYNVLGREVATLVNEYKPAGKYEVEFDASKLPSGIYIYKLSSGDYNEVKKMILMK